VPVTACLFALATLQGLAQTAPQNTAQPVPSPAPHKQSQQTPKTKSSVPGPAPIQINRMVVVLDPAHGGMDSGSRISDATLEKDVTLALAFRLRSLLSVRGFTVVMTRDADSPAEPDAAGSPLTLDDRAGIANHAHAAACLLLHATGSGNGVHLYSSELVATAGEAPVEPWLTAQAAWVPQSQQLEKRLASALTRSGIALVTSRASVRPVDSLTCPALVVELAPGSDDPDSINDTGYQQRVAQAIVGALVFWQSRVQPPVRLPAAAVAVTTHEEQANPETQP
jgi:N-acetylmuramoyl-L-alanine amidase